MRQFPIAGLVEDTCERIRHRSEGLPDSGTDSRIPAAHPRSRPRPASTREGIAGGRRRVVGQRSVGALGANLRDVEASVERQRNRIGAGQRQRRRNRIVGGVHHGGGHLKTEWFGRVRCDSNASRTIGTIGPRQCQFAVHVKGISMAARSRLVSHGRDERFGQLPHRTW